MIVSAKGRLGMLPWLFNTANPSKKDINFGVCGLGSPNKTCDLPGPGEGIGGKSENCIPSWFLPYCSRK
jgi:hypothetical protein